MMNEAGMRPWTPPEDPCLGCLALSRWQISRLLEVARFACDSYAWGRCIFCVKLDARRDSADAKEDRGCKLPSQRQTNTRLMRKRSFAKKRIFVKLLVSR